MLIFIYHRLEMKFSKKILKNWILPLLEILVKRLPKKAPPGPSFLSGLLIPFRFSAFDSVLYPNSPVLFHYPNSPVLFHYPNSPVLFEENPKF